MPSFSALGRGLAEYGPIPAALLAMLCTLLPNRYAMCDALIFADAYNRGGLLARALWHPSHLLYGPLGGSLSTLLTWVGLRVSVLQAFSLIGFASALGLVVILFRLLRSQGVSRSRASLCLCIWVSTYAVWECATSSDFARNMPALFFVTAAFAAAARCPTTRLRDGLRIGVLLGLAGLSHTLSVFAAPALGVLILRSRPRREAIGEMAVIGLGAAAILVPAYAGAALLLGLADWGRFMGWFASPGSIGWAQPNPFKSVFDLGLTALRGLLGPVDYGALKSFVTSAGHSGAGSAAITLVAAAIAAWCLWLCLRSIPRLRQGLSPLSSAMAAWLLLHGTFALFFDGGNIRMVLYLSVPLLVLLCRAVSVRGAGHERAVMGAVLATLLFVNGYFMATTESRPQSQPARQTLAAMGSVSREPGDLFLVRTGTEVMYAWVFGARRAYQISGRGWCGPDLVRLVRESWAAGQKVYLDARAASGAKDSLLVPCEALTAIAASGGAEEKHGWILLQPRSGAWGSSR